ncbi:MAG: Na+:solute symporter [Candidatus Sumerlaeia bacterium]|nr:Na+:solute symporter [Candidatus Sumerlaeia bacterium]
MQLTALDWSIFIGSLIFCVLVAAIYTRRASKGTAEFFASGRAMPWWLLGTSMVATTFSTDTPNLVTNLVRENGVANNWVWWAFLVGGMLTVFFYARLWRRSGVLTDLEFYEIRYAGKSAAAVRGFRAIYLGLFFNCVIMASVTLAAVKIGNIMFGWSRPTIVLWCSALAILLSVLSGLWGVVVTDLVQFIMAMTGAIAAAYYSVKQVGGLSSLVGQLDARTLSLLPDFGNWELAFSIFILPLAIQWWSVWYPGAEPGGGSYIAQRMLAARDERHAMGATLWFNVAHYALRPWPWILVALCSLIVYPTLGDIQKAFPHVSANLLGHDIAYPAMLKFLPAGFLGIMVASLAAAYFSTIETHLNWGASYLVHDFYRRFIRPGAGERHLVLVSRIVTALLMVVAGVFVFFLETAKGSFDLMLSIGAGTGLIYLLRWFWWRINAWSEIAAMISSFAVAVGLFVARRRGLQIPEHITLAASVAFTTLVWVTVTFLTRPTPRETLIRFYRLTRPFGPGWKTIREAAGVGPSPDSLPNCLLGWLLGCALVYSALFGTGCLLYGKTVQGLVGLAVFAASAAGLAWLLPKIFSRRDAGK